MKLEATPSPSRHSAERRKTQSAAQQLVRTCLDCGAPERKCKLFCACGDYASCSDFL